MVKVSKELDMQLTKAEEQVMLHLWEMGEGLVKGIRDRFDEPKPVRNTVSTVLRILEKKEFVWHRTHRNVHVYFPLISKDEYSKTKLLRLMKSYFNSSFPAMALFFVREKGRTIHDLEQLIEETKRELLKD